MNILSKNIVTIEPGRELAKLVVRNERGGVEHWWTCRRSELFVTEDISERLVWDLIRGKEASGFTLDKGYWRTSDGEEVSTAFSKYLYKIQHEMAPMLETIAANTSVAEGKLM